MSYLNLAGYKGNDKNLEFLDVQKKKNEFFA